MYAEHNVDEIIGDVRPTLRRLELADPELPTPAAPRFRLELAGVGVDHLSADEVVTAIGDRLAAGPAVPLAIGSVNLDHIHHFGSRGRHRGAIRPAAEPMEWLMLIDGSPVAHRAQHATGLDWPRVTGADLLPAVLDVAERSGARVGFLGGYEQTVPALAGALAERWPELIVAGHWTPSRHTIEDFRASRVLAGEIAAADVDLLVVGLGKPRQEKWIHSHGHASGASVLTAFGAAADFLAGAAHRAPAWMRRAGIEWTFRLAQEPRRLSRRYLLEGPRALRELYRTPITVEHPTIGPSRERQVLEPSRHW